jgi:hypothetical protein
MALGLSDRRLEEVRPVAGQGQAFNWDKKIAFVLLTITLSLFAFMIYGVRNDTAKIITETTPVHIYHRDYFRSDREREIGQAPNTSVAR